MGMGLCLLGIATGVLCGIWIEFAAMFQLIPWLVLQDVLRILLFMNEAGMLLKPLLYVMFQVFFARCCCCI